MNTIGVVLLAAASATSQLGAPHAGGLNFLRSHVVQNGPPPPGGPITAASMGAGPGASAGNRRFPNVRSQLFFVDPAGMKITWQTSGPNGERVYLPPQLTVPARYNFNQGYIYRLKISDLPGRKGLVLYPTIEVAPSTPATDAFLTHNPIPCQFTDEDFDQITAGNFVTKVVYLPDPKYQELAIAGVETLVSTRLEPGVDPIREADRRGTILMIIRIGMIDLEMPSNTGTMVAPGTVTGPSSVPATTAPFSTPPSTVPPVTSVPLDAPPVAPAPGIETAPVPPTPAPTIPAPGIEAPPAVGPAPVPPPVGIEPVPPPAGIEPAPPPAGIEPTPAPDVPNPAGPASASVKAKKAKALKDGSAVQPASASVSTDSIPPLDLPAPDHAKP